MIMREIEFIILHLLMMTQQMPTILKLRRTHCDAGGCNPATTTCARCQYGPIYSAKQASCIPPLHQVNRLAGCRPAG